MLTITQFRKKVKQEFPNVKIKVSTVRFTDLARGEAKCLKVTGDKPGQISLINLWARCAGIQPDGNIRFG